MYYFKSLYFIKLEYRSKINDFSDRFHLTNLSQDQVNNLNRIITRKETKAVIKLFHAKETNKQTDRQALGKMVLGQSSTRLSKKS
jgi:polysaccharide pyruvyl transferase WcaK-like protein